LSGPNPNSILFARATPRDPLGKLTHGGRMSTRMHDTLERLERWLREHQPVFLGAMRFGSTDYQLDELQVALGRPLPEEVRAFYRWRGGIEENESVWEECPFWGRPMTPAEVRRVYEKCCERGKRRRAGRPGWWHPDWVPIFDAGAGRFICVDTAGAWTGDRGQIVWFDKETDDRIILAAGLGDFLRALVVGWEQGLPYGAAAQVEPSDNPHRLFSFGYPEDHSATEAPVAPDLPAAPPPRPKPLWCPTFGVGDRVRLVAGSFANHEGLVKLQAGTWRIVVTLTFWGRPLDVPLDPELLEVVEHAQHPPGSAEWAGCGDAAGLFALLGFTPTERKLRLLVAAVYGAELDAGTEADVLRASLEAFAEDRADILALRGAVNDFWLRDGTAPSDSSDYYSDVLKAIYRAPGAGPLEALAPEAVQSDFATPELIRELFTDPFAPPRFDPAWRTADVVALARGIYEKRAFEGLPVLADALQEAGCDNDELLNHLRDPERTHVRGCWALDLCLGVE
jgi:cell wall assembly regulator SMI1